MIIDKVKDQIQAKYIIGAQIGRGGNAEVFDVIDKETNVHYALKILVQRDCVKQKRFQDEIDILVKLKEEKNCGIVKIKDFSKESFWYIMPQFQDSFSYLKNNKDISIEKVISIFISLVQTLIYIHSKKIYHRDIKPANIYVENETMILGDFGLVDYPDKQGDITESDRPLGAIFTIAPEMRRDPVNSDCEKADVYSLAKTLWMFLTLDEKGFDGQYNFLDETHRLRKFSRYKTAHLVEIEELIADATSNDPEKRPRAQEFLDRIKNWQKTTENFVLSQKSEWEFITKVIFGIFSPNKVSFDKIQDIQRILSVIANSPAFNHMFFASTGGSDLEAVENANEKECLVLILNPYERMIIKPKCLYYCGFKDIRWNYFLLELDDLSPVVGDSIVENKEYVVEDYPGNYVSGKDSVYGVYDYDTGKKLPKGFKRITRCLHEKLLFTMKMGPYNNIPATYDAWHAKCDANEFYNYILFLSSLSTSIVAVTKSDDLAKHIINHIQNPFQKTKKDFFQSQPAPKEKGLPPLSKFVHDNYSRWNFSDCFFTDKNPNGLMHYYIALQHHPLFFNPLEIETKNKLTHSSIKNDLFIMNDGTIHELVNQKSEILSSSAFYVTERTKILSIIHSANKKLADIYLGKAFSDLCENVQFSVVPYRTANPTHLFTKEELLDVIKMADDRVSNRIVIDESGKVLMIPGNDDYKLFPVYHEIYMPRNNYVGKYSSIPQLEDLFYFLRNAWLKHLKTGEFVFVNDYFAKKDEKKLNDDLQVFYPREKSELASDVDG